MWRDEDHPMKMTQHTRVGSPTGNFPGWFQLLKGPGGNKSTVAYLVTADPV